MGSVRKVAVTAGLGAAMVAGAAGPALADGHSASPLPTVPTLAEENAGTIGPFPISQMTDTLGTGKITGGLTDTAEQTLPLEMLPTQMLPPLSGTPTFPGFPGMPGTNAASSQSMLTGIPDLGVPGMPGVTGAVDAVTPGLPGIPGVTG